MINSIRLLFNYLKSPRLLKPASFLLISTLIFWQCVSPPDFLGGDLIPGQDIFRVKVDTTFRLSAYTVAYDTVSTMSFSDAIVGETYDMVFGRSKSSFLSQLRLSKIKHRYGVNSEVDSAFLYLKLKDRLGNEPINIRVYQLSDSIAKDSVYNALSPVEGFYYPQTIGILNSYTGDETIVKIPLNQTWVIDTLLNMDTTFLDSNAEFIKHFFGIYVKAEGDFLNPAKGMYYFDYTSTDTRLSVYYRTQGQDTLAFDYLMEEYCYRFNHFEHYYNLDESPIRINFRDTTTTQDSVFYLQGLAGTKGIIMLDDVAKWIDSMPIAISRAELRLELVDEPSLNLPADTLVNRLYIYSKNNNKYMPLIDYQISADNFGGQYIKSKKYYSFNITYHIQDLLKSTNPEKALFIEPFLSVSRANNAILRSGSHSKRMKLIITYTKF
jgi:hypothetical protein